MKPEVEKLGATPLKPSLDEIAALKNQERPGHASGA